MILSTDLRARLSSRLSADRRAEFLARLSRELPLLHERLSSLYGAAPGFEAWFAALLQSVAELHTARPAALCSLDIERSTMLDWFQSQDMLGYCAYVDRFAGDLNGVAARIPYLRELGVRYLHLLPFLRTRAGDNDGGFAVSSYDEVEPRLGSMSDLEALTGELRAAGISLCADLVLNHVADDHPWALAAAAGDAGFRRHFHTFADRDLPDRYEATLGQVFPLTAPGNFTEVPAAGGWVWTTFYPYQWDLNYTNPEVFAGMALALLRLANRGVEVFRLDSAPYLWKRVGTDCRNQPEAHWILQALRCLVQIAAPGVLLKAEAIVPTPELPPYFGEGDADGRECQLAYQSSLMAASWAALAEQHTGLLHEVIAGTPPLPPLTSWISYVRCHDDIGWNVLRPDVERSRSDPGRLERIAGFFGDEASGYASGSAFQAQGADAVHGTNGMAAALLGSEKVRTVADLHDAEARLVLLYGLALCIGGLPLIYMGDELAQGNDYSEGSRAARDADGRWLQRPPFDERRWAQRLDPDTTTGRVYARLRALIACRKTLPCLAANQPTQLLPVENPALLALRRGSSFLAVANFSGRPETLDLRALPGLTPTRWRDCFSQRPVPDEFPLDAWGQAWLQADSVPDAGAS